MADDGIRDPRRWSSGGVEALTLLWPESDPRSLGVEDELLLVHPVTHTLVHASARVLAAMALPSNLAHAELDAACVELASAVCADVSDAIDSISALRPD